ENRRNKHNFQCGVFHDPSSVETRGHVTPSGRRLTRLRPPSGLRLGKIVVADQAFRGLAASHSAVPIIAKSAGPALQPQGVGSIKSKLSQHVKLDMQRKVPT